MVAVLVVVLSQVIATCNVEPAISPLADIAAVPVCGAEPADGFLDQLWLNPDLSESATTSLAPIHLVINRPSAQLPDGAIGNWPKPKTTIEFYDKHSLHPSIGDQGPMNGRATVNEDGTFEIWVPAYRNGGYKERAVRMTGKLGPGNAITIDEYWYHDDFVHTSSLDSSKTTSVREYKKGPVTICR